MKDLRIPTPLSSILLTVFAVAGCASEPPAGGDTASDGLSSDDAVLLAAAKVALPPTDVTPADLPDRESEGARLLDRFYTSCHWMPSPSIHSQTDWPIVLRRMWMRTEFLGPEPSRSPGDPIPVPTSEQRAQLMRYLLDNALQVADNLPELPGRELFSDECSDCHDLPDPQNHSASDWVAVVDRMADRMETMLDEHLSRGQLDTITNYLQAASGIRF